MSEMPANKRGSTTVFIDCTVFLMGFQHKLTCRIDLCKSLLEWLSSGISYHICS